MKKNLHFSLFVFVALSFQLLTLNSHAQASFSPATTFPVGSVPYSVTSADFNGDGKADLAVANNSSNNISVLLGNGIGGFGTATNFAVGNGPTSLVSADFNSDGKVDLAVANGISNNIKLLIGDGAGGFTTGTNTPVGNYPFSIISTDFNGDGKADLAVANYYSNNISVLIGDGAGGFALSSNDSVGSGLCSVISADFNGDGKVDLASCNQSSNNISVLLGDGAGNFSNAANFGVGSNPSSVIIADFNDDGKADLATANQTSHNISVLLGDGAGNFATSINFAVGGALYSLNSADINADGKADLSVTNITSNSVSVLLGNGVVGFGTTANFAVGTDTRSLISVDFNGDGQVDLALVNPSDNAVSVLLNNLPPSICLVTVDSSLTHNVVIWEKTNLIMTAIDSFIVYREIATNSYQRIGAVSHDSLSTFDDFVVNPASTAYRYKIKSKNTSGVESPFSDFHNTIYLTNTGANFSWTPYQVENKTTPVSTYVVYRDDNSIGNFQTIGSTTGNQFGYTDVDYSSYPNASYYVEAVMSGGTCKPTRSSGFSGSRSNVLNNISTITIFPTPAGNILNITGIKDKTTLRMYDVVGKLVMEKEVENNAILSTSQFTEGVYTLLSESKTGRVFNKVVISR